jgi:hypothetical protein
MRVKMANKYQKKCKISFKFSRIFPDFKASFKSLPGQGYEPRIFWSFSFILYHFTAELHWLKSPNFLANIIKYKNKVY